MDKNGVGGGNREKHEPRQVLEKRESAGEEI